MSAYTITLTAEQDAALAALIARTNVERAMQKLPAITIAGYIQSRASEVAGSYAAQLKAEDEAVVIAAYKAAATAKQASIKTTLGI